MNKEYGYTKQAESHHQGSKHTLAILMSKLRSSLGAAWSMARVWLEYAYSMLMTTFLRPFSSKRAELERRLAVSMFLMLTLGSGSVWGATIDFNQPDGYYYLGNDAGDNGVPAYDGSDFNANFYMCPAYSATVNEQNYLGGDSEKPLITTYKSFPTITKTYSWAVWYIEAATGSNAGCFYIKHRDSGKYLVANDNSSPAATRRRVNLGPTAKPDGNDGLFYIQSDDDGTTYYIYPKEKKDGNNKYLTPSNGNKDDLSATSQNSWTGGIIGFYTAKVKNSAWHFVLVPTEKPTITYDNTTNEVTMVSATTGATIYYTTDGSEPDKDHVGGSNPTKQYDSNSKPTISTPTTIKAIAVADNYDVSEVRSLSIQKVETPIKSISATGMIELSSATPSSVIYYTIGDTEPEDPTASSTLYTGPLDNVIGKYIKAIGVKEGWINSDILSTGQIQLQCATPVITRVGMTFTISCVMPADAAIYYSINGGSETLYSGPVAFTNDQLPITVTAVAKHSGYTDSEEASITLRNGSGTPDDPYLISGDSDFSTFITDVNNGTAADKCFKLISDISASGVAEITTNFTGTFDGGGYTISGLSHPLFNAINGGVVKNVMLKNVHINQSGNVGAITGEAKGYTRIYNCGILPNDNTFSNRVRHSSVASTDAYCGGLVGWLKDDSRVINCFSFANVNGGTEVAGIVGYNGFASTTKVTDGKYTQLKTAIVNCMFYGNITGGSTKYPVYGGNKILNNTATGINNYDFYRAEANLGLADNDHYNCSWPAQEEYLTKYEYYRYLLNSNRELCGWWVGAPSAPSEMSTTDVQAVPKDASLIAKWVLDPSIAPYPILKAPGKYFSAINQDPDNRINPVSKTWESRQTSENTITTKAAPDTEGQKLGSITVTINKGGSLSGSSSKSIPITAMDIENNDFCYGKIQLPYYNSIFGDPNSNDWTTRYGGNYKDKVVVGWEITSVTGGTEGTLVKNWQDGYNFTDRDCTNKDKERIFAQGGYYYVPNGVSAITITAKWADAVYLDNSADHSYDRVYMSYNTNPNKYIGYHFAPAGSRPSSLGNDKTVQTASVSSKIPDGSVYEKAIVLVGNHQYRTDGYDVGTADKGCTIISADFDFDDEPDYCLEWQLGTGTNRQSICPIRFDFLPVIEIGMAMKEDGSTQYYSLGCYLPLGHFEVTETSLIHFGQFEFGNAARTKDAPLILNGGIFDQYCKGTKAKTNADDHIDYVILGGNVYIPSFSPGAHVNAGAKYPTRHCAVNVLGGRINNLYLTGNFNNAVTPNTDNPHCYIDGGNFKQIAAAAKEGINGDVYFRINHSVINEFYGGSTLADKLVTGNINVTVDNSKITKYCGGPKFGNMASGKTVTTNAIGTTFGVYYGGGNGGTSYVQYESADNTVNDVTAGFNWNTTGKLNDYTPNGYRSGGKNYMADYEMEIVNTSTGTDAKKGIFRTYLYAAQFSATNTGPITNNLTDCKVLTSFYGGGNLGGVIGDVTSTLTDTKVQESVFGAGYSASVPEVTIYNKDKTAPTLNVYTGLITPTPNPDPNSTSTTYTWCYKNKKTNVVIPSGVVIPDGVGTSKPAFEYEGRKYLYTEESLENLGTVTGKVTLNIEGTTTVAKSVYGGGEESGVAGNTEVNVTSGTIGTQGQGGVEYGNVFGGGKGKVGDKVAGYVKGNTAVNISQAENMTTTILHNVYGGGAYGSVGDFTYDATSGMPTALATENTGVCNIAITGGTIGTNGKENGMIFGSSRGLEANPSNPNVDKMAWVYDTDVTIGIQNAQSNATPWIKGSVYGGGENGHNFHDAKVTVHSGTIGMAEGAEIIDDRGTPGDTSDDISYTGARFPNRGNVYGSGCGTDTYTETDSKTYFDFNAGIVRGNTTVLIDGGHVVHNVYGGGAMGSVGTYTFDANGKPTSCTDETGTCTVTVSGGQIGVTGAKMAGYGKGGPDNYGHVFGAGRGEMHDPDQYPNMETCAFFNKTILNISGTAFLTGSAYGGSESGHVLGDTEVNISGGQIGCGKNASEPYGTDVWADSYIPTGSETESLDCASWPFTAPFAPYDPFANATGDLDKYPNGKSTDGGRLEASDGHTYYGNVFGGGSGRVPYFDTTEGISKYLSTAGSVEGKTKITISGGHIITNVYGGCEATNVKGSATITMTGGTVGVPRTVAQIIAHPNTGYIFGAGKGDQRIFFNKETNVDRTEVNIEGGRVYGSIFGGGEDGHVFQNAIVNIGKADTEGPTIGTWGTSYVDGNVFGGGRGFGGEALTAGNIGGSIELNIKSGKILGSVYGGGRLGSVGYGLYLVDEEITEDEQTIKPYGILRPNDKYDGSYPNPSTQDASAYYDKGRGYITINISGGTIGNDYEYIYNPTDEQKAAIPNTTFDYQNHLQYTKGGNVFTGGMGRLYALDNTTLLPLWPKLGKCKQTTLNMTGGTVKSSIYGGGEIGAVAQNATVNVNGGTVGTKVVDSEDANKYYYFGSVFGGGKGSVDNITYPSTTPEAEQIPISEAGTTGGDVLVKLNEGPASSDDAKGAIVHQVFGCNDMNGSPKGDVTVHVYATQNADKVNISTKYDRKTNNYDVETVYGGGNLAAYEPEGGKNTTKSTKVIIDGCGLTSIKQVYGGGNAASTPATNVTVNGTYEILELFGGGNGFDKLPDGRPNPGANVGYKNYTIYEEDGDNWVAKDDPAYDTKEKRTAGTSAITYGTGQASVNVFGGTVHRVFGGSNTKGNVRQTAVTKLDEVGGCDFCVDEAYGGGKSAPMDAEAKLHMACIPGLQAAYGGAEAAAIKGNVTLNITNGTFDRVFGGNNLSGTIDGSITVNIQEVGCRPIKIGELYGGGNQAGYSVYGYNDDDTPKETGTKLYDDPQVNVMSFTSIGKVFGGGFGSGATMVGNPTVNVNEVYGKWYNDNTSVVGEDAKTSGNYPIPSHAKGKMGAISEVFGGGNAAKVIGNTTVNVGTLAKVSIRSFVEKSITTGDSVEGLYTRSGEGTEENPYIYTAATGNAVAGTKYYEEKDVEQDVLGVDIRGNVYGGGNNAEVTGNTNVVIGKQETTTTTP